MHETEMLVSFRPSGKEGFVLRGTRLIEAAADAGIVLDTPCGGEGTCGKCRVQVTRGACEPTAGEARHLSAEELRAGWRLACQTTVCERTEAMIPAASLIAAQHQILTRSAETATAADDPPIRKCFVQLPAPSRGDDASDLLRLERVLQSPPLTVDLPLLRALPSRLREYGFRGTAVLDNDCLLDFEEGDTAGESFAVALDIGTTTLAATLLDLATGDERAVTSRLNPQTQFGDDVLSRILHARQSPEGLRRLHGAILAAVDAMLGELCEQAGAAPNRIYELVFAGNTTMQQLLCGVDPSSLGEVPFVPATQHGVTLHALELGLHMHPRGMVRVLPVIGGFVGGDTVAGMLATALAEAAEPTLFVDIGTNGEIVLAAQGRLWAASTAAGPAFEGARISRGMRGCSGAIEKVTVNGDGRLHTNVIGNVAPIGLCGSGLIDAAAELLRHGLLTCQGKLQPPEALPDNAPHDLARRLIVDGRQVAFELAAAEESADGRPILLTQRDLRELQLAAGAVRAGILILLQRAGLRPEELDRVLIGGGFGNFIRRNNAQRIGLLPSHIEHHRIRYLGNTALAGARLTALSRRAGELAEALAGRTQHVDLSTDVDFQNTFADAMIFPER